MIDLELAQQVREIADWFLDLPTKLVEAVMGPREKFLEMRERIEKAKELAALREVGKSIQSLYFFKGSIRDWIERLQAQESVEDAQYVRELFAEVAAQLERIEAALKETPVSNAQLGAEASLQLAKARQTYSRLAELPDSAIFGDHGLGREPINGIPNAVDF